MTRRVFVILTDGLRPDADVPPTICHWLGVPVPHWYEGRALTEAFVAQPAVPLEA